MLKTLAAALVATSILAAPVHASPAAALSLSRAGATVSGESNLSGLPVSTWLSLAAILVSLYLSIGALSEGDPISA